MHAHHAVVYVTKTPEVTLGSVKLEHQLKGEIIIRTTDTLSIAEVRQLIEQAYQTPGDKDYRLLVVVAAMIASEAQQALLKILEEPPATTRFVFILPDVTTLLPTVLSRVLVHAERDLQKENSITFTTFLARSIPERLLYIADIAKKKDETVYQDLFRGLTQYGSDLPVTTPATLRQIVASSLRYLRLRGASKKMLWEELALSLPATAGTKSD